MKEYIIKMKEESPDCAELLEIMYTNESQGNRGYGAEMKREEDSFVLSAVHRPTDSSRQNPDFKSLKTKYGKEIRFTPDSILMTNNQGMLVEMKDSEGITISSNKNFAADDSRQVKLGSTSMTLDEDIHFTGGESRVQ